MKEPQGIVLYFDFLQAFKDISNEDAGSLIKGMISYAQTKEEPTFVENSASKILWPLAKNAVEHSLECYEAKVQKNKLAGLYSIYKKEEIMNNTPDDEILTFKEWKNLKVKKGE